MLEKAKFNIYLNSSQSKDWIQQKCQCNKKIFVEYKCIGEGGMDDNRIWRSVMLPSRSIDKTYDIMRHASMMNDVMIIA